MQEIKRPAAPMPQIERPAEPMQEIELLAEQFLGGVPGYIWDGRTLPVPIEEIADSHAGLLVLDVEDLGAAPGAPALPAGQTLSGLLLPGAGEIWVNAAEARAWPPRRRFTIAHELGHWRLHRGGDSGVFCRAASIAGGDGSAGGYGSNSGYGSGGSGGSSSGYGSGGSGGKAARPQLPAAEEQANAFAAALLMPAGLVREHHRACGGDFARLCELFAASAAAMRRRLAAVL